MRRPQGRARTQEQQRRRSRTGTRSSVMEGEEKWKGEEDLTRLLPQDVLAQVLCRLAPRDLAASRCVCAEWKGAIDGRRLLRADLLPLSVGGIFLNMCRLWHAEFFRPGSSAISGNLAHLSPYVERGSFAGQVLGHCNGLVLLDSCVVNPATGWFAPLPPMPRLKIYSFHLAHCLVFDPAGAVSSSQLHYSVLIVDPAPLYDGELQATDEWPPSTYLLHVFSSRTGRWEERPFLRQGEAAGTIADVRLGEITDCEAYCFAAYWKQALYVHCANNFFLRISLSKDEYRVIKPPAGVGIYYSTMRHALVFGKSEKGPCLAEIAYRYRDLCLKVWVLDESNHESSEWALKHCNRHLGTMLPRCYLDNKVCGPWIFEDINYIEDLKIFADDMEYMSMLILEGGTTATAAAPKHPSADCACEFDGVDFTLDSVRRNSSTEVDGTSCCYIENFWVIGFHPYKENIVFFASPRKRSLASDCLAYDMNSSKFQYLGSIYPTHSDPYSYEERQDIGETFVYTPCKLEPYGHPAGSAHLLAEVDYCL